MKYLLIILCLVMAGCTSHSKKYQRFQNSADIFIRVVEVMPSGYEDAFSMTRCIFKRDPETNKIIAARNCEIFIQAKYYPHCITHEVRHVLEGEWHGTKNSTQDCVVK